MSRKRSAIYEWFQHGKRQCEIFRLLNVARQTVSDVICRFKELSNDDRRQGRERKRTANTLRNSEPAHKGKKTQERCKANFPDMISSVEWSPYQPDLNRMDYSVWSVLESRTCTKPHKALGSLKQ
ncbi:DDE_3 domain-containing protein [Trichonephila clavipes]|nr:DDE_3 domain-containing protein [Trichonephila clavipes]